MICIACNRRTENLQERISYDSDERSHCGCPNYFSHFLSIGFVQGRNLDILDSSGKLRQWK
jgi:hypothetical protein